MIVDATVAPQAIRYPTDLSLLNEAREFSEQIIEYRDPLDGGGDLQWGLPVAGFWAFALENSFLGEGADVIANYGGLFGHKTSRCFDLGVCRDLNPQ